jgi:hypothetical protein
VQFDGAQFATIASPFFVNGAEAETRAANVAALGERQNVARGLCVGKIDCEGEAVRVFMQAQRPASRSREQLFRIMIGERDNVAPARQRRREGARAYRLDEIADARVNAKRRRVSFKPAGIAPRRTKFK